MKKTGIHRIAAVLITLVMCLAPFSVFAETFDLWHNTLNDQVTLVDIENLQTYTIGYTVCCSSKADWNLELGVDECSNSQFGRGYLATVPAGSTLSAQISCMSGETLGIYILAYDENKNEISKVEIGNAEDGAETVDAELVVPDDAAFAAILMMAVPQATGFGGAGSFTLTVEMTVEGKEDAPLIAAPVEEPDEPIAEPDEPVAEPDEPAAEPDEPVTAAPAAPAPADDLTEQDKDSIKSIIIGGGAGAAAIVILILIIKGAKAKAAAKAATAVTKAAVNAAKPKAPSGTPGTPKTSPSLSTSSGGIEDSYVVTDPATGAQTLYVKDDAGNWVSSDGGSVLDTDRLGDWEKERANDRKWQDQVNEDIKKPTKFEDIDKKQAEEEAQIHRDSYMEKVAIKHGMDTSDMDAVFDKVALDQARDEVFHDKWMEVAQHNDTAVKVAENLKTTADYSISALATATGPAGEVLKDVYTAGTTIGGNVSQAVAEGKDAYEIAQVTAASLTEASVGIIQNHAPGLTGKAAANIIGDAAVGGTNAYVAGKDVGEGIATGVGTGMFKTGVDAGNMMVNASTGGSGMSADGKAFSKAVNEVGTDFVKNTGGDAIENSFDKTFNELNHRQQ